ncbi:TPA: hypothetical protein MW242_003096 [Acinetobacter baumannii]|nr:hypothetical protein [Acinetobacter baumannii]
MKKILSIFKKSIFKKADKAEPKSYGTLEEMFNDMTPEQRKEEIQRMTKSLKIIGSMKIVQVQTSSTQPGV